MIKLPSLGTMDDVISSELAFSPLATQKSSSSPRVFMQLNLKGSNGRRILFSTHSVKQFELHPSLNRAINVRLPLMNCREM